jgi:hypothetical protein
MVDTMLDSLDKMYQECVVSSCGTASFNSRPLVTAAEGVYKAFVDECPMSFVEHLLLRELGYFSDPSMQKARESLLKVFGEKVKVSRTHADFVCFIRKHFDVAIKRWK